MFLNMRLVGCSGRSRLSVFATLWRQRLVTLSSQPGTIVVRVDTSRPPSRIKTHNQLQKPNFGTATQPLRRNLPSRSVAHPRIDADTPWRRGSAHRQLQVAEER